MDKQQPRNRQPHQPPHKALGRCLKTMRQRMQESLGETSGAVEIAVEQLDRYERGAECPTEDILLLLINHFGIQDDEAVKVWELAGYDTNSPQFAETGFDDDRTEIHDSQAQQPKMPHVMLLALDTRVMYSNGVNISGDNAGLVLSFLQNDDSGRGGQPNTYPVSRIGMSYDQAERLLTTLQKALLHKKYMNGPKQLPPQAG